MNTTLSKLSGLTPFHELQRHISLLANVERGETPMLSCYLNLRQNKTACRTFLNKQLQAVRQSLRPEELNGFDEASGWIHASLDSIPPQTAGLALFARNGSGGPFYLVIPLAVPVGNRLSYYTVPDLYPLVESSERYGRFLLVFSGPGGMQLLDVNLGAASVQAWSALPPAISDLDTEEWGGRCNAPYTLRFRLDKQVRLLQLHLRNSGHRELLLAGVPAVNDLLIQQLPEAAKSCLVDSLSLKTGATADAAIASALDAYQRYQERCARKIADRVLMGRHEPGSQVTGLYSTLDALQQKTAKRVVMIKGFGLESGWSCARCGESRSFGRSPDCCPACGNSDLCALEPRAEIMRLATQQGIPITLVPPDHELRYLGGVACLLHQRVTDSAERTGRLKLAA